MDELTERMRREWWAGTADWTERMVLNLLRKVSRDDQFKPSPERMAFLDKVRRA
jgi:hypothetical protein